jgi:nicotinamidase-related amidase
VPRPGDIVAQEHWCSSGFANTDLDLRFKKHGIQRLIVMGLIAHTCVEATVRYAAELGYDVTMVKDATHHGHREPSRPKGLTHKISCLLSAILRQKDRALAFDRSNPMRYRPVELLFVGWAGG